jgi:hypothetical protein
MFARHYTSAHVSRGITSWRWTSSVSSATWKIRHIESAHVGCGGVRLGGSSWRTTSTARTATGLTLHSFLPSYFNSDTIRITSPAVISSNRILAIPFEDATLMLCAVDLTRYANFRTEFPRSFYPSFS